MSRHQRAQSLQPYEVQRARSTDVPQRAIESPYLSPREALVYLRLRSFSSLYYLINEQRLPFVRRGGRYLFDRRDLDAWLRGTTAIELIRSRRGA